MKKKTTIISGAIFAGFLLLLSVIAPEQYENLTAFLQNNTPEQISSQAVTGAIEESKTPQAGNPVNKPETVQKPEAVQKAKGEKGVSPADGTDCPIKASETEGIEPGGSIKAYVKKIVDGDTLWAEYKGEEYKVRLLCVDTPETVKSGVDEQPYGIKAKELLTSLVLEKEVFLVFEKDVDDRYDRLLAYILLEDGGCVNALLVEQGYARIDIVKPNNVHQDYFTEFMNKAIAEGKGLWSLPEEKRPFVKNEKGKYVPRYIEKEAA